MKADVISITGKKTGRTVDLADDIFGIEPNDHAIYLAVKSYQANQRQGTHSSLTRSMLSGSTKKLHKQKGTGGSRKGSIKSPLFKGGARMFGPHPRDYSFKLNVKVKDLARKSALAYKVKDGAITIVEDFKLDAPKTKSYVQILKDLGVNDKKSLLVLNEKDHNIHLASRNIPKIKVTTANSLNTYEILNANHILFVESSLKNLPASN
jgi:large subunit ribosomal protein L4